LRGVVWDIDGTLADSFNLAFGATNRVLERNGVAPVDGQAYIDGCRFTTPVRLAQHAGFDAAVDSQRAAALAAEFDADYIALVTIEAAPLFPGVRDLLRDLARHPSIKSGCLTNAAVGYAEAVVKVHSLEDFVSVHGADDVPRAKPFADGLIVCASDLQLDPAECFYVGDSVTDGQAARAAEYGLAIGVCARGVWISANDATL
ncbi:HAD-like domain-containing protein, partial [Pelagophyceae sp. CCMP2097]